MPGTLTIAGREFPSRLIDAGVGTASASSPLAGVVGS
jgi:hypothetical protein